LDLPELARFIYLSTLRLKALPFNIFSETILSQTILYFLFAAFSGRM